MRIDRYTKILLTIIALALVAIAVRPLAQPQAVAAQGPLSGLQLFGGHGGFYVADGRTGEFWLYGLGFSGTRVRYLGKMTKAGEPLSK